jgi:molecular chaperone DnaK (HSP70)
MQRIELSPSGSVGLDFGTTNSAIATVIGSQPTLAEFPTGGGTTHTFPSVHYFERRKESTRARLTSAAERADHAA